MKHQHEYYKELGKIINNCYIRASFLTKTRLYYIYATWIQEAYRPFTED